MTMIDGFRDSILARLPHELLYRVCLMIQEPPSGWQWKLGDRNVEKLDGISRACHRLREFCSPILLHTISIKGEFIAVLDGIDDMLRCGTLGPYVR